MELDEQIPAVQALSVEIIGNLFISSLFFLLLIEMDVFVKMVLLHML